MMKDMREKQIIISTFVECVYKKETSVMSLAICFFRLVYDFFKTIVHLSRKYSQLFLNLFVYRSD